MNRSKYWLGAAACAAFALVACQSTNDMNGQTGTVWPIDPSQSIVQTDMAGFNPMSETGNTAIVFALYFKNPSLIRKWEFSVQDYGGHKKKVVTGNSLYLPATLGWDGKTDDKKNAEEGKYTASLRVNYGSDYPETYIATKPFILDTTDPSGMITFSPTSYSPLNKDGKITFTLVPKSDLANIDSWSMEIYDPALNLFMAFYNKWPKDTIEWDGMGFNNEPVVSAEDYPVIVKVRDEFGGVGTIRTTIPVDIRVIKEGENYRIDNSRIYFQDFTSDFEGVGEPMARQNVLRLDQLAAKLKEFPKYDISIVGHAVMINWDDDVMGKIEQEEVLVPLSKSRAEAIKREMVLRGINPDRISTRGAGADDPLVPNSDYINRWKNRRTVIYLTK